MATREVFNRVSEKILADYINNNITEEYYHQALESLGDKFLENETQIINEDMLRYFGF